MRKISVVIPNYNGVELLQKNLPEILSGVGAAEVIVVDDASIDESVKILQDFKLKIVQNAQNLGFASTVNRGVQEASGELILLLNSDVIPQSGFLAPLIKHFSDPKVFAVGCLQKCPENGKVIFRGRGVGKFERGFLVHSRGAVNGKDTSAREHPRGVLRQLADKYHPWGGGIAEVEESKKTLWVFGGAGMFRKSIWEKLGGLDTLYNPFYWEDIDISYRALKAGYKLVFEPKSVVYHDQEEGAIRSLYSPQQVKTIAYRNQILFVWLNIIDNSFLLEHFIYLPYYLIKAAVRLDSSFIKAFLSAIYKIPQVISHRFRNKKMNIIGDQEILATWAS